MPNGVDKNLIRLAAACAEFKARYGAWPDEARLAMPFASAGCSR